MSDNNTPNPTQEDGMPKAWKTFLRYLKKFRLWWNTHLITPFNGVSRIHYYEARERYFSLMDLVRYQAKLRGLNFPDFEYDNNFEYPKDIEKIGDVIRDKTGLNEEEKNEYFTLLTCYESLIASRNSLTRRQGDLNRLWRTMARVRSRINRIIVKPEMQSSQLYFCQEESFRLGVDNDPSIKSMLQDLAEAIDSKKDATAPTPKYNCVLNALIERFNTIRTGRIHQQFVNVRTYTKAFVILMLISVILIQNHDFIMSIQNNPQFDNAVTKEAKEPASPIKAVGKETTAKAAAVSPRQNKKGLADGANLADTGPDGQEFSLLSIQDIWNFLRFFFKDVKEYIQNNMFAFIFFGGVTGGFFSVATRARTLDRKPGEDVYYTVYVLTKPFIGALGAIILYILIHSDFVTQNFLNDEMVQYMRNPGTTAFGFAFIAGFSERIVFPKFR